MATGVPTNASELQLYRVLQRSNLLSYYDTFIQQGGDDVQQLCEAGEEEFLEIMALVGMSNKPLHVRRLQKTLQEWVNNRALFQRDIVPSGPSITDPIPKGILMTLPSTSISPRSSTPSHAKPNTVVAVPSSSHGSRAGTPGFDEPEPYDMSAGDSSNFTAMQTLQMYAMATGSEGSSVSSMIDQSGVLSDDQIERIAQAADELCKTLPLFEPKFPSNKKKISRELEIALNMSRDDPMYLEEVRKYAAIYGRFDAKRRSEKPLTTHEVSVNEAATHICKNIPALLTRREDLFPLARQVVRESGYAYTKGHSRAPSKPAEFDEGGSHTKRLRTDSSIHGRDSESNKAIEAELQRNRREERMSELNAELKKVSVKQEETKVMLQQAIETQNFLLVHELQTELERLTTKQLLYITEQSDLIKKQKRSDRYFRNKCDADCKSTDGEGEDSRMSSGVMSSPEASQDVSEIRSKDISQVPIKMNPQKTKQLMRETLFDEGLRVAQQHVLDSAEGQDEKSVQAASNGIDYSGIKNEPP